MSDMRKVELGTEIPSENYCDQPYVVVTANGNWLCVLTTGQGLESTPGQHVVATISADRGRSWTPLIDIEPPADRMTSWVTAFMVPSGRVYAVYNLELTDESTQHGGRLCYRFSDDDGQSWSGDRYSIPMRQTAVDRANVTNGREQFFWCIDKPVVTDNGVFFGIPKLSSGSPIVSGESWVIHSANILHELDPERIKWELLPEGDTGITNPELGDIQEEQNLEVLSDGSLYMVFRTELGVIGHTISCDGGKSWTTPQPVRYPDGRPLKNPRACPKLGKTRDGRFLLWFHNNGFPGWGNSAVRNPVWITGGVEVDGTIRWSQPEVLLYASDPTVRGMSYPDFFEYDGEIWVSETEKMTARIHRIDRTMLEGMWSQHEAPSDGRPVVAEGPVFEHSGPVGPGDELDIPSLPSLSDGGFSVELVIEPAGPGPADSPAMGAPHPGETVLSSYGVRRRGFCITTAENGALQLEIRDARSRLWLEVLDGEDPARNVASRRQWLWRTDPGVLEPGKALHVVFIVDGRAKIVSVVANGRLLDGGEERIQGWWRLNPWLDDINDAGRCSVGEGFQGRLTLVRLYNRYLRTAEAVRSWRAVV